MVDGSWPVRPFFTVLVRARQRRFCFSRGCPHLSVSWVRAALVVVGHLGQLRSVRRVKEGLGLLVLLRGVPGLVSLQVAPFYPWSHASGWLGFFLGFSRSYSAWERRF